MTETPKIPRRPPAFYLNASKDAGAVALILLVLLLPNRLSDITPAAFARLPLEALLLGLLLIIPGRSACLVQAISAGILGLGIVLKLADIGVYQAFGRPFNPVLDARFPADGLHLLKGAVGWLGAWLAIGLVLSMSAGLLLSIHKALGRLRALLIKSVKITRLGWSTACCVWLGLSTAGNPVAGKPFYDWFAHHLQTTLESWNDLDDFNKTVDNTPDAGTADISLFAKLKGKDVLVVFIESYGRTVIDKAVYSEHIRPLLARGGKDLADKGLFARSAYLTSPTYGGISWLAHGTLLSGLWIDSQSRYDRLVMSKRPSLNRLFQRAGWRTVAVEPAHTIPWPQGEYFGYEKIYASQDLNYKGQPFNWITMPDQYTLSALQTLERGPLPRQPVMAEIALISSHAPWTPLPRLVDWQQVGNGSIFNHAREGDAPEAVWQDTENIREQYRKSIEYVLNTLISYATTYGDENLVMLVLGDHQPAPFVTGDSPNHDVPVHLITRDAKLIEAINDWQWSEGLSPTGHTPVWGMDTLRDHFIAAFSTPSVNVARSGPMKSSGATSR